MPQLEGLDGVPGFFDLMLDFFDEEVPSFFLEDVEGVLNIADLSVEGLKRNKDILCLGLFFLEFVEFFRRGPEGLGRELLVEALDFSLQMRDIKDNLGALRSSL